VLNDIGRPEFVEQLMMALHQVSIFQTFLGISKKCKRQRYSILPTKSADLPWGEGIKKTLYL